MVMLIHSCGVATGWKVTFCFYSHTQAVPILMLNLKNVEVVRPIIPVDSDCACCMGQSPVLLTCASPGFLGQG